MPSDVAANPSTEAPGTPYPSPANPSLVELQLKVLQQENDHVHETVQRSLIAIYGAVGVILPGVTAFFVFVSDDDAHAPDIVVFAFVAVVSLVCKRRSETAGFWR
jgi:hypothetical protein